MPIESMISPLKPWQWRSQALNNRSGSEIFAALFIDEEIATLLESPGITAELEQPQLSRYSICAGAPRTLAGKLQLWIPETGKILPWLRFAIRS